MSKKTAFGFTMMAVMTVAMGITAYAGIQNGTAVVPVTKFNDNGTVTADYNGDGKKDKITIKKNMTKSLYDDVMNSVTITVNGKQNKLSLAGLERSGIYFSDSYLCDFNGADGAANLVLDFTGEYEMDSYSVLFSLKDDVVTQIVSLEDLDWGYAFLRENLVNGDGSAHFYRTSNWGTRAGDEGATKACGYDHELQITGTQYAVGNSVLGTMTIDSDTFTPGFVITLQAPLPLYTQAGAAPFGQAAAGTTWTLVDSYYCDANYSTYYYAVSADGTQGWMNWSDNYRDDGYAVKDYAGWN